ncbi:hypothetical protein [Nocardioides massiliensis]|uniref:hypothetical protein n=1 Tax=Nocardioides massiliensis TaxID=1325935 RepID=UPI0015EBE75D|nr:hypothetical protein [Nocardioides massiliensis]
MSLGNQLFEVVDDWLDRGVDALMGRVAGLAERDGIIYVLQCGTPSLLALHTDGTLARCFPTVDVIDGHGIAIDDDGSIWIADRDAHAVYGYTAEGELFFQLGSSRTPYPHGPLSHPTLAVKVGSHVLVADGYAESRVSVFDLNGRLAHSWGEPGRGRGQFRTPHSLCVTHSGHVAVADRDNDRVQVFTETGTLLAVWDDFLRPMDLAEDAAGFLYVTEQVPRLSKWAPDGSLVGRCRIPSTSSHGLCLDGEGNIYLAEMLQSNVTRLVALSDVDDSDAAAHGQVSVEVHRPSAPAGGA